jgi:MoaA/NifB/PqqE/SkfB family radical SAM enzyme
MMVNRFKLHPGLKRGEEMLKPELKNILNGLDPKLARVFLPWAMRHPRYLFTFNRLINSYKKTKKMREDAKQDGLVVPPFLILSITSRCNLSCVGCYAAAVGTTKTHKAPLGKDQWRRIIADASEVGVFGFVIAGGEPFLCPGLLELCEDFKDSFFIIVTNGTAITDDDFKRLKRLSNVAILVSIEGGQDVTDARRGSGVYEHVLKNIQRLLKSGVLTGISVTVNRLNHDYWMNGEELDRFIAMGVKIGVFIEYIPVSVGPDSSEAFCSGAPVAARSDDRQLILTKEERERFRSWILDHRAKKPIYLIHSPGDEEFFGGCVSAGRGFAHITPEGDLTPCPVSNVATHNLTTSTLREGLASQLFKEIRESEHLLENSDSPCALFSHPEEVEELAKAVGAYRTS